MAERIQKALTKKEYEKAYELIQRGLEKEPLNPGINYYKGLLFFEKEYAGNNLDTARLAIKESLLLFENATADILEDLEKDGITAENLTLLFEKVRDENYQVTIENLSLATIAKFFEDYPNSIYHKEKLQFKRDSIDFQITVAKGTTKDYSDFIKNHQTSVFTLKADSILDVMRFHELEQKGTLNDYYLFLNQYPNTRFRNNVETYVLKVSTASHELKSYEKFLSFSEVPALRSKVQGVLYFLQRDYPFDNDSLNRLKNIEDTWLYPVVENDLIGFYDFHGVKRIDNKYVQISDQYKCDLTKDDWIFVMTEERGVIVDKSGRVILNNVEDYKNLSADLALIQRSNRWWLYHKNGYQILESEVEQAELIDNLWIKVKQHGKWGLASYLGLEIAESIYDDIYQEGHFWFFERNGLIAIYTKNLILNEIEDRGLSLEFKFDDIEMVNDHSLIGFRDDRECLLDSTLSFLVPWGTYQINPEASGWYLKSEAGYRLYNESAEEVMNNHYPYLETNEGWLAIQTTDDWMLLPRRNSLLPSRSYDSIKLINRYSALLIKDHLQTLLFLSGNKIEISDQRIQTFQNQANYLRLFDNNTTTLLDQNGDLIIEGKFDDMHFLNDTLIKVLVREKYGLVSTKGDWILNPVFEALDKKGDLVLTLIKGKIGCYDPKVNKLIETEYESSIHRFGSNYLAKKDGKFGVIDFVKKEILPFRYDDIKIWNDSTFLVEENNTHSIIKANLEVVKDGFQSIQLMVENERNNIFRFVKNGKYGLMSNRYGELLEPEFTDILNISTQENPFFFADQHLDKAGFHVVSYINEEGKLILSKAYTRAEFDKILCDN